jgi:hypothetical protein
LRRHRERYEAGTCNVVAGVPTFNPDRVAATAGREDGMKLWEVIYRIDEMAFRRRAIIDRLRALQTSINSQALKIIVYPDSQDVTHWRREFVAWGNDLAAMQLRGFRGVTPMGFTMAWNGLYRQPFEGAEDRVLQLKLGQIEREYQCQRPVAKDRTQILAELTAFLRAFCQAIGESQFVDPVVNTFQGQPMRLPEAVAE